jgi:heme/copper-type cytochrome/quinol oxidase subunit 3
MQTQRPIGVTLFVIWSFLAGIIAVAYVLLDSYPTVQAIVQVGGQFTVSSFLIRVIAYVILIVAGFGYCAAAVDLLQGRKWGRIVSIAAASAVSLGWIGLGVSALRHFYDIGFLPGSSDLVFHIVVYIVVGLINALPIFYLMTTQFREYCKSKG